MSDLRMPDINRVELAGRLTQDAELKYLQSGMALCTFNMASSKKYETKSGEKREDKLFVEVTVWGKSAEYIAGEVHKGSPVLVEGSLKMSEWEDKDSGKKRSKISINATRVHSLAWGGSGSDIKTKAGSNNDDEIPY